MSVPTTSIYFSDSTPAAPPGDQICTPQTDNEVPQQAVTFVPQRATADQFGTVKPDNVTIGISPADNSLFVINAGTGGGGTSSSGGVLIPVIPSGAKDGSNTQFILPAPLLAGTYGLAFLNGVLLMPIGVNAEYAVQGIQFTTKYPPQATDRLVYYYIQGTPNSEGGGGGGVVPSTSPVLRGSAITNGDSVSSLTLALPSGTQAGDLAIFFFNTAWTPNGPGGGGWTTVFTLASTTSNMLVASKILTSDDISAGSITTTQTKPPFGAIADVCALAIVTFIGATGGVREAEGDFSSGTPFTITNTTTSAVINTDIAIYYASTRGASEPTPTITPASGSASTLKTFADTVMAGKLAVQAMPGGVLSVANAGASGGGAAAVQVIVKAS